MKYNKSKIFVITSIVFLLTLIIIYGSRLVYYYQLENKPTPVTSSLTQVLIVATNIVTKGDGLYKNGGEYLFKGNDVNNYLYYSGRLWRIIGINNDKSIKLITNDVQTSLVWNYNSNDYQTSYVYEWLNVVTDVEHTGLFYNSLDNQETFIAPGNWCIDIIDNIDEISCEKVNSIDKVGLLEIDDYKRAGGKNSYLNQNFYEWTINGYSEKQVWYRLPSGDLGNDSNSDNSYYSYGVRPVINLRSNIKAIKGNGSKENPYIVGRESGSTFAEKKVGEYVSYSDYTWRIMDKTATSIKVIMDGYIKDNEDNYVLKPFSKSSNMFDNAKKDNIGYYLNREFYNSLNNNDYIVTEKWNIDNYNSDVSYDYKNVYKKTFDAKVGLASIGDLFINDFDSFATITGTNEYEETIYTGLKDGRLYADSMTSEINIRPAIYLDIELIVTSGTGTSDDPYIIGR